MKSMERDELVKQPQDVTECPYSWSGTRPEQRPEVDMSNQYFYAQTTGGRGRGQKRSRGQHSGSDRKRRPQPTGPCWFCLGSPEVEKHLVVSVGTTTYMALAKGGLVSDHILILPIGHYQSSVDLPEDVILELEQYKSTVRKFFKSIGKTSVIFERNFKTQHLQLQVVSVGTPYFYVELDNGERLLHQIKKTDFFPLQFGREVMACEKLLDMPERANWKTCSVDKEEETRLAQDFRKKFGPFDFNDD